MTYWRAEHTDLLQAIRADSVVARLVRRLTRPSWEVTADEARRWRGWGVELRQSAAADVILSALDQPSKWPAVWEEAESAGFSPRCDHHSALFFTEVFRRTSEDELELARLSWRRALRAWSRLEQTDYLPDLAQTLSDGTEVDARSVVESLLVPHVDYLLEELKRALQLNAEAFVSIQTERASWAWRCLDDAAAMVGVESPIGLIERARQDAIMGKAFVVASASTRFRRGIESIDWAAGDDAAIVAPFVWLAQVCEVVEYRENTSTMALQQVIDGAWKLRKINRDSESLFGELIEAGHPFAEDVAERIESGGAFGHGSRVADYLVFMAEEATEPDEKRVLLERALEFSPNHRNASLLLSYLVLADVELILSDLALSPTFVSKVSFVGDIFVDKVWKAWALCNRAEELYPYNSELEGYRTRVRGHADRAGVTLPRDSTGDSKGDSAGDSQGEA